MSERPVDMGDESHDEIIAGEYVLGVLSMEDRIRVESRISADASFAMRVRRWQDNLESLDESYGEIKPPQAVLKALEEQLFAQQSAASTGMWNSLAFWRGLTAASLIMAAGFGFAAIVLNRLPSAPTKPLLAEMTAEGSAFKLVASYDSNSGRLRVTPAAASQPEPKSLELWLIEGEGQPLSLGVLPQTGDGEVQVPEDLRGKIGAGATFAVSLEPLGGSPTGLPTGPVLATGKAI